MQAITVRKNLSIRNKQNVQITRLFIYKNLNVPNLNQQAKVVISFIMTIFNEFT